VTLDLTDQEEVGSENEEDLDRFIVLLCGLTERSPAGVTASAIHTKPYHIAIIIKATDSAFRLYAIVGAVNYSLDNPDKAKVSWYGPKSEAVIDQQVVPLEDIVSKKPKI
jgi:hypothetical protein